jgi:tetratricopeptide (TPR) repeat protein
VSGAASLCAVATGATHYQLAPRLTTRVRTCRCRNKIAESIGDFDKVIELDPQQRPYMWQRGLSLFYAERQEEAMEQFEVDVAVNPNDTEESIWRWLAQVRLLRAEGADVSSAVARARGDLLKVGTDPRPVMRSAMELFAGSRGGGGSEGDSASVEALDAAGGARGADGRRQHDRFCT